MRLAVHEVRPDEDHGCAGRGGQQDQARDIAVDLVGRQVRSEEMGDEQPAEQRHREGLHQPVDADRDGDPAPMLLDLPQSRKVDFQEHRDNHQPDQHGDRQIDLRDFGICPGPTQPGETESGLSDWLAEKIEMVAGRTQFGRKPA
jgi:hypothetical protein